MGGVIVVFRVMPEGVEVDLDKIKDEIEKKIKPQKIEKVPIAFGLSALKVTKLVPEKSGAIEDLEKTVKSIDGVSGFDVLEVSRSL